jgi:hypothetical protein
MSAASVADTLCGARAGGEGRGVGAGGARAIAFEHGSNAVRNGGRGGGGLNPASPPPPPPRSGTHLQREQLHKQQEVRGDKRGVEELLEGGRRLGRDGGVHVRAAAKRGRQRRLPVVQQAADRARRRGEVVRVRRDDGGRGERRDGQHRSRHQGQLRLWRQTRDGAL